MVKIVNTHTRESCKKRKPLLLFDIDGTLLITGGSSNRALERVFFEQFGVKRAMDRINPNGKTDPIIIEEMYEKKVNGKNKLNGAKLKKICDTYIAYLEEALYTSRRFRVLRGVRELLNSIKDKAYIGLLTGNLSEGASLKLKRANLLSYFSFGAYGSDSKKREELVKIAVKRASTLFNERFKRNNIYLVGDTPRDVLAAKHAKVRVIAVASGSYSLTELKETDPDFALKNLANIDIFTKIISVH